MKLIHLISGPRNISTALMYSFAQRRDTKVVDEPFYGYYLHTTNADHPGKEEVMNSLPIDANEVIENLISYDQRKSIVFIKNMAHHLEGVDLKFLCRMVNVILIRDPKQILSSYHAVRKNPTLDDIGLEKQFEVYNFLVKRNLNPFVINSNEVLKNPKQALFHLCERIQIPFDENMLQWSAGPIAEDGVWAKYWYGNVHKSTGFEKQETSTRALPDSLLQTYQDALPYYEALNIHAIKS